MQSIVKRNGAIVPFESAKIAVAMEKAFMETGEINADGNDIRAICGGYAKAISAVLDAKYCDPIHIEVIQDEVETFLMSLHPQTARAYILYRKNRASERNRHTVLMKTYHELVNSDAKDSDVKRENANIDGDTAMGTMLKFGAEGSKEYYRSFMLSEPVKNAHSSGDIHIHDMDFYSLTTTCTQIDIERLFKDGFSTGHGFLREPSSIASYSALAAIAIQGNQNDQHGGQSIPNFDHGMVAGVKKSLRKNFRDTLILVLKTSYDCTVPKNVMKELLAEKEVSLTCLETHSYIEATAQWVSEVFAVDYDDNLIHCIRTAANAAVEMTDTQTHQAMEAFVHNLNTMHSRAGAQVPFSSINYGTNTSAEGRMVIKNILKATEEGLGNGETPIFPIQIFRVKKGTNYEKGDPNYDLFQYACKVSAKRLFPNFSFQDAPFNLQYYDPERPETEIAYMGCRTRVIGNVNDRDREISYSRGNLSFTSINLPRLAIEATLSEEKKPVWTVFYEQLEQKLELVATQLLERFEVQCAKKVRNYPFLMGQGVWLDSERLGPDDSVAEVLKHGTLSIGFIGLAECLTALYGRHHGEDQIAQEYGLQIVQKMRDFCDQKSKESGLNFTLIATPAEGLSGRFVGIDKKTYGEIPGITDREYYTNSFHVPVSYDITAYDKIRIEAPYHALTNAGHITYVEMDGDPSKNLEAFETIVKCMAESGVGYGAINHPLDRDPVCGYNGIIDDECPKCGRHENDGKESFERIRRITGYLVGTTDRFNNAKRAEERDRKKHC